MRKVPVSIFLPPPGVITRITFSPTAPAGDLLANAKFNRMGVAPECFRLRCSPW